MVQRFPETECQKRKLRFRPVPDDCLLRRDTDTLRNLRDVIVFIFLKNGSGGWYYIKSVHGDRVEGYVLSEDMWNHMPISLSSVLRYY
ncbi:MAG: hypothetical protein IJT03_08415 [Clostridia bacterium]|nr:hypothetical protein [Clostridia bacterium]